MLDTALIAATANLTNLLDLRPGRAAKVIILLGSGLSVSVPRQLSVLPWAACRPIWEADPCSVTAAPTRWVLQSATAAARAYRGSFGLLACAPRSALNLASEQVSFTAVIERTPLLRRLDQLGRPGPRKPPATERQTMPA